MEEANGSHLLPVSLGQGGLGPFALGKDGGTGLQGKGGSLSNVKGFDSGKLFSDGLWELNPVALDESFRGKGFLTLAGVDEAGRGPLAGPVVAAAVILPPGLCIEGLTDSKVLSRDKREKLAEVVQEVALSIGVGIIGADEIDRTNIFQATVRAMREAVAGLGVAPDALLVDGPAGIGHTIPQFPMVRGDARSHSIAAASVVAKVTRDRIMVSYDELYPQYGFARHKGYGTPEHMEALRRHGCCPLHRKTFRGVRECLGHGR